MWHELRYKASELNPPDKRARKENQAMMQKALGQLTRLKDAGQRLSFVEVCDLSRTILGQQSWQKSAASVIFPGCFTEAPQPGRPQSFRRIAAANGHATCHSLSLLGRARFVFL